MRQAIDQAENFLISLGSFLQFDIFVLDLVGTAFFAYGGAVVAFQHRFSLLGAMVIALATATGGGTLRSLLVGAPSVFWISHTEYLIVIGLSVIPAMLPRPFRIGIRTLPFHIADAFSTAIFVSLGVSMYLEYVNTIPAAVAMAVLTGMGGGLIRDMLVRRTPQALIDPAYPFVVLGGTSGGMHAVLTGYPVWIGAVIGVFLIEIIRGFLQVSGIARHAIGLAGTAASGTETLHGEWDDYNSNRFPYPLMTLLCVAAMGALVLSKEMDLPSDKTAFMALEIPVSVSRSKERYHGIILEKPTEMDEVAFVEPGQTEVSEAKPRQSIVNNVVPEPVQVVISDSDVSRARVEFDKLVKAIELRNTLAVNALTTDNANRQKLFSDLFSRYIKFDLQITDYEVEGDTISAMLTLNAMLLPDGNLTLPSESYRTIPVAIMKHGESWSLIQW